MVQGLKFLSKKGFNPQNQSNRKQVWEAQQQSKLERERIRRREEELKREREDEEICKVQHGDSSQAQLRFMYNAPVGLEKDSARKEEEATKAHNDVTKVQTGDDAAAAAFRRLLFAASAGGSSAAKADDANDDEEGGSDPNGQLRFAPVLQGSKMDPALESDPKVLAEGGDSRSALEKAVGRRDRGGALTLEEQLARFPQLKYAPMAKGMSSTNVNVSFKPLGAQLRNVRCLACGQWGHSRGDRECPMTGWDPFAMKAPAAAAVVAPPSNDSIDRPTGGGDAGPSSSKKSRRRKRHDSSSRSSCYYASDSSEEDDRKRRRRRQKRKRKKSEKRDKGRNESRRRRDKESGRRQRSRKRRSESPRTNSRSGRRRRSRSRS